MAENQVKKNYNKIHLLRHWKCCYAYFLKFICVQRSISLFLIALRTRLHQRFLVLFFCLRFDQIGNKLQQPFTNQRHKFTRYTKCQHYAHHFWSWLYTTSVGIKNQVFWAGPCSYNQNSKKRYYELNRARNQILSRHKFEGI